MLKRFMNWLLHRLQNLLGKKRGNSSAPNQSRQSYDRQGSQQGNRPVATSRPTVSVIDPVPEPTAPPTPETLPTQTVERSPFEPAQLSDAPEEDPAVTEGPFESDTPDKHRRVDIAPSAIPDIKTVSPTFPTEVSELMGSPSNSDDASATEATNAELPVRSLKKIPTSQLPGIHDLLPAVEPSTSEDALPSDVLAPSSEPEQAAEPEQATLFSFDIIEREPVDTDERGDELLAEEPSDEDSTADILGSDSDLESPEEAVLPAQISIEMEAAIETDAAPVDARIETLPYPWSLPVTGDSSPEANKTAAPTEQSEVAQDPTSDLIESISEDRLTKNGVVKLLFTLKEGNFHGYIAPDDGTKDILFHQKYINADVFPLLERGVRVTAAIKYIEGKAYATRVDLQ